MNSSMALRKNTNRIQNFCFVYYLCHTVSCAMLFFYGQLQAQFLPLLFPLFHLTRFLITLDKL